MSKCWLCGSESDGHHLGCQRASNPDLTKDQAIEQGLLPRPQGYKAPEPDKVEYLKEGSMTTVPADQTGYAEGAVDIPEEGDDEGGDDSLENCEYPDCTKKKYSDHPRVKYCEEHRDPKNRKE